MDAGDTAFHCLAQQPHPALAVRRVGELAESLVGEEK